MLLSLLVGSIKMLLSILATMLQTGVFSTCCYVEDVRLSFFMLH